VKQKQIVILFVLLAFVSQAFSSMTFASPMNSHPIVPFSTSHVLMANAKVSCDKASIAPSSGGISQLTTDCCKHLYNCPMNSCLSTVISVEHQVLNLQPQVTVRKFVLVGKKQPPRYSSLYRPPILA
jgi:hypothetical protein